MRMRGKILTNLQPCGPHQLRRKQRRLAAAAAAAPPRREGRLGKGASEGADRGGDQRADHDLRRGAHPRGWRRWRAGER